MPATTASPARMLPCAVQYFPAWWPAHAVAFGPVNAAVLPCGVDDGELPALLGPALGLRIAVAVPDRLDDRRRRHAGAQQRDRLRPVADVDDGLGGGRADAGLGPQHAVADGEHARLHRAADFAGGRVEAENRERRHRIELGAPAVPTPPAPAAAATAAITRHRHRHPASPSSFAPRPDISPGSVRHHPIPPDRRPARPAPSRRAQRPRAEPHQRPPAVAGSRDLLGRPAALGADRQGQRRRRAARDASVTAAGGDRRFDQQQALIRRRDRPAARRHPTGGSISRHDRPPALLHRGHRDPLPPLVARSARSSAASLTSDRAATTGRTRAAPIITASRTTSSVASPFSTATASV